jgi:hypothetical protein
MSLWRQTLTVALSVKGLGNFPCATHSQIVDLANEVSFDTSEIRNSRFGFDSLTMFSFKKKP